MIIAIFLAFQWLQTDWSGGPYQSMWSDTNKYLIGINVQGLPVGDIMLKASDEVWVKLRPPADGLTFLKAGDEALFCCTGCEIWVSFNNGISWDGYWEVDDTVKWLLFKKTGKLFAVTSNTINPVLYLNEYGEWVSYIPCDTLNVSVTATGLTVDDKILLGTACGKVLKEDNVWQELAQLPSEITAIYTKGETIFVGCKTDTIYSILAGSVKKYPLPDTVEKINIITEYDGKIIATGKPACILTLINDTFKITSAIPEQEIISLIKNADDKLYALSDAGRLYKKDVNWSLCKDFSYLGSPLSLLILPNQLILVAGKEWMYCSGFHQFGYFESSVFDRGPLQTPYGKIYFRATGNPVVKVRTGSTPDMSDAMDWDMCPQLQCGDDLSVIASVNSNHRYVQYMVEFNAVSDIGSPVLHEIRIEVAKENIKALQQLSLNKINIYPNPAKNYVIFNGLKGKLTIYDMTGRLIKEVNISGDRYILKINGEFKPGIYICRTGGKSYKFVVIQ